MKRRLIILCCVILQIFLLIGMICTKPKEPKILDTMPHLQTAIGNVKNIFDKLPLVTKEEVIKEESAPVEAIVEEPAPIHIPTPVPPVFAITQRAATDMYPDDGESVATISVPAIGLYQVVTYGDSQANIDKYEIVIRNGHRFNQHSAIIVAGHNYKSFASLKQLHTGDKISVHTYYGDFSFIVDSVTLGTTNGNNIYDAQGNALMDLVTMTTTLYLYTCDDTQPTSRLLVSAHPE